MSTDELTAVEEEIYSSVGANANKLISLLDQHKQTNLEILKKEWSMLETAALNGYYESAKVLIERGAKVNTTYGVTQQTPLHFASKHGHVKVMKLLIDNGADINVLDRSGHAPIHKSCIRDQLNAVRWLIANDAKISDPSWKVNLFDYAKQNNAHSVYCFIKQLEDNVLVNKKIEEIEEMQNYQEKRMNNLSDFIQEEENRTIVLELNIEQLEKSQLELTKKTEKISDLEQKLEEQKEQIQKLEIKLHTYSQALTELTQKIVEMEATPIRRVIEQYI